MLLQGYIQTPEVGKFYCYNFKGSTWENYGTALEVTPKWIRFEGFRGSRGGWVKRDRLETLYCPSTIRYIPSSVRDH